MKFSFKITKKDSNSNARTGIVKTPRGKIKTPVFMPCATKATVKTLTPQEVKTLGYEIILGNAYHLYLRPGLEVIKKFGSLHNFMGWQGPILTDSGGFQVFSLSKLAKIKNNGVEFRSHIDGSKHFFTPEKVIKIQQTLGSDLMMPLDVCLAPDANFKKTKESMGLTHQWLLQSIKVHKFQKSALFGIVQGGFFEDLRKESARFIAAQKTFGIAIGGVSVGETRNEMYNIIDITIPELPLEKPRHLLGVGEPIDILESVERGIDMFDCVLPTRLARHNSAWTKNGRINLRNQKYQFSKSPIEKDCQCFACQNFSAGYLRHLTIENEMLGARLLTIHNLYFLQILMQNIRQTIKENKFLEFKKDFVKQFRRK